MQALWANQHVDFKGKYHTIDDSGINPRPKSGQYCVGSAWPLSMRLLKRTREVG